MRKLAPIPYFLNSERTPLVDQLLEILKERDDYINDLEDELNRLKKLPPKPTLDKGKASKDTHKSEGKRPGSKKEKKTSSLEIHETHILKVDQKPVDAHFKGHRCFVIQDISIKQVNHLFKCERWQLADGSYLQAKLPIEYQGHHFGPQLRTYILHQIYTQGVTRGLLLNQLKEWGIKISKGQLNNLLINHKAQYHTEKKAILSEGFAVSSYFQVDDTGARHAGKNGFCTYIGNEYFAFFESSFSKSRLNYLHCLKKALPSMITLQFDKTAFYYLQKNRRISGKLLNMLSEIQRESYYFIDEVEFEKYLKEIGIFKSTEIRLCKEAALFSTLKKFLFNRKEIFFISDEAGQFRLPDIKQSLCWLHIERKFKQLLPYTEEQHQLIKEKRTKLWVLYESLKNYKVSSVNYSKKALRDQFHDLCEPVLDYQMLNEVLARIKKWEKQLLLVLDYPYLPLHNNNSERDIREMVRRRKVSGGTRHDLGRECRDTFASLKKTCQKVGITFWDFLMDRTFQTNQIKPLAEYVRKKAMQNQKVLP
jgi:Transposase IS66 family